MQASLHNFCFVLERSLRSHRTSQTDRLVVASKLAQLLLCASSSLRSSGTSPNDRLPKSSKHEAKTNEACFSLLTCWSAKCDMSKAKFKLVSVGLCALIFNFFVNPPSLRDTYLTKGGESSCEAISNLVSPVKALSRPPLRQSPRPAL